MHKEETWAFVHSVYNITNQVPLSCLWRYICLWNANKLLSGYPDWANLTIEACSRVHVVINSRGKRYYVYCDTTNDVKRAKLSLLTAWSFLARWHWNGNSKLDKVLRNFLNYKSVVPVLNQKMSLLYIFCFQICYNKMILAFDRVIQSSKILLTDVIH